jgi:hypothetical protein
MMVFEVRQGLIKGRLPALPLILPPDMLFLSTPRRQRCILLLNHLRRGFNILRKRGIQG